MATASLIPVQQYLDGSFEYEPDAEFVDGEIELRPMGEYDHATWQQAIERWFLQFLSEWNIRVRVELRVQVAPTRYRIPDVVVFNRDNPIEQILTLPPIAVFEVLSPEDRMSRMMVKLVDYQKMGIRTIRVVDPKTKTFYAFEQGRLEPIECAFEPLSGNGGSIDWQKIQQLLD